MNAKRAAILAVVALAGCVTAYPPRGVVTKQDRNGGSIALYNEDDVEPSQHIARKDAERQMAEHCAPRGFEVTGWDRYDTGNAVAVNYGYGVSSASTVKVKQLHYECRAK